VGDDAESDKVEQFIDESDKRPNSDLSAEADMPQSSKDGKTSSSSDSSAQLKCLVWGGALQDGSRERAGLLPAEGGAEMLK